MKTMLTLGLALLLSACATTGAKPGPELPRVERVPPADALVLCERATALEDDSFGAVVRKLAEVAGLLEDCASKHGQLVDFEKSKKGR